MKSFHLRNPDISEIDLLKAMSMFCNERIEKIEVQNNFKSIENEPFQKISNIDPANFLPSNETENVFACILPKVPIDPKLSEAGPIRSDEAN